MALVAPVSVVRSVLLFFQSNKEYKKNLESLCSIELPNVQECSANNYPDLLHCRNIAITDINNERAAILKSHLLYQFSFSKLIICSNINCFDNCFSPSNTSIYFE